MKTTLQQILLILLRVAVIYICCALIQQNYDPIQWSEGTRVLAVILLIFSI